MKDHRFKNLFLGLLSAFVIDAGTPALAFYYEYTPAAIDKSSDVIFKEEPVGNEELDDMRGGFVTSNGMIIDFSFSANTLIDGQLVNQIMLNTADLAASADALRSIIQIGEGNQAFDSAIDINILPNVLTVVQNNMDNVTFQQLNLLDLTVQNMDNFIKQSIIPEIDFQNTMGLAP